jgi:TPR repeat protein
MNWSWGIGGLVVFAAVGVCAQEELVRARVQRDCAAVRATIYRMEDPPTRDSIKRIVDWAKRHPDDLEALFCAGQMALGGWVEKGEIDAIDFLKRAAENGHAGAMALYGIELCTGENVKQDTDTGLALMRKAAEMGEALAYFHLGTAYEAGKIGVPTDLLKATAYYQIALEKGMTRSLQYLARVFKKRDDIERMLEYAHKGAEAGDTELMSMLALWYFADRPGRDPQKAASWLERGASRGSKKCMRDLAVALDEEIGGLKRDPVRSRGLLERAAELGDAHAIVLLDVGRVTGRFGIRLDKQAGMESLRKKAADGSADAQFELAALLGEGKYVDRDMDQAVKLLEAASRAGNGNAEDLLTILRRKNSNHEQK